MRKVIAIATRYKIYRDGRVWSDKTKRFLKPRKSIHGFLRLVVNGRLEYLHILLAKVFKPNPYGYKLVRHLDDDKLNNDLDNLVWGTHGDNTQDAIRNGKHINPPTKMGSENGNSKLSIANVLEIRYKAGKESNGELAKRFGVNTTCIGRIIKRQRWKHI